MRSIFHRLCGGEISLSSFTLDDTDTHSTGLAAVLMKHLEVIGSKIPGTAKTMLTCFTSNARGIRFYTKLGYSKDEYSPPPRMLRNGTKVEAEYVILSKVISR
jgi:RimJ/RimL family protein N-acetyltransferase